MRADRQLPSCGCVIIKTRWSNDTSWDSFHATEAIQGERSGKKCLGNSYIVDDDYYFGYYKLAHITLTEGPSS